MRDRPFERNEDYEEMRRDQQERQRQGRGYGDRERMDYDEDRARYARQPNFDPERDRYGERWPVEDSRRGFRDRDFDRSPAGEHDGPGTRFYGSRDFGWYGGHGRGGRDFGTSREFEREDYERPGMHGAPRGATSSAGGPRGYKRSDERIREDVCDCLMQDPEVDATNIDVRVQDGTVILDGMIDNRRAKHRAENLCEWIPGVQDVTNHLRVRREVMFGSEHPSSSGSVNAGSMSSTGIRPSGNNPVRS